MARKIICLNCKAERQTEHGACKICGSEEITVKLIVSDKLALGEKLKGKAKVQGKKRPTREFQYGDDFNRDRQKYVDRAMIVDRENNMYYEKITDKESKEIIHECKEPLDKHYGHGKAKKKQ